MSAAREIVATVRAADEWPPVGGGVRPMADAVSGMIFTLDERAGAILDAEQPATLDFDEDVLPELAVTDAAGRAIAAARLEREPGTNRFIVVLLSEGDL